MVVAVSLTEARSRWLSSPGGRWPRGRRWRPAGESSWWLALVAAAFTASQLAFVSQRLGLSWDETVYVSQVSVHAPAAYFDPARARGIPLLAAPVTLLTSSVLVLRVYLSVASGAGLFLALLAWRRLRPVRVLALAGLIFGGLWTAEYYGPQAMPDLWVALSGLAAVGLFLQASARLGAGGTSYTSGALAGLAACVAFAALVRPGDAVFLAAPLTAAPLAGRSWRRWQLPAATLAGLAAGGAEWVIEAYLGVRSPCLIKGEQFIPIAFYAGCASAPGPADIPQLGRAAVLEYPAARPPRYARHWQLHELPGTRVLKLVAYLPGT
jgi:hypothetical protein